VGDRGPCDAPAGDCVEIVFIAIRLCDRLKHATLLIARERRRWIIFGQHQVLNQAFYFESRRRFSPLA